MAKGEIYFVTKLAADLRTGDMSATESREGDAHTVVQGPGAAEQSLQLIFSEAVIVIEPTVEFATESKTRGEVVLKREATGINMAMRGLDSEDAGTGVPGKEVAKVSSKPCLV